MATLDPLARYSFVPSTVAPGPFIVGGDGVFLHTADGRKILDGGGGAIVSNIGHGRAEVADAVAAAMKQVDYVVPLWITPNRLALRDALVERWLPDGFDHVFFASGGSESIDSALRLARAYQVAQGRLDRWKIVGRHPSYHGITIGTISAGSHSTRRAGYEPMLLDFPKVPWDDPEAVVKVIEREDPATIAGFVAEPVTGAAGGCLVATDAYWQAVTDVCRAHDIVLIADEVMTGFGRCGEQWGHQAFPFVPDVIAGGKGLGGGYVPMGMVAANARIAAALVNAGQFMFFTFTGADAMCAGATAVLEILEREALVARARKMGGVLERRLRDEFEDHPHVCDIRGKGLFWGIEFVRDRDSLTPYPLDRRFALSVVSESLARDLWVYPAGSGPVKDAVMIGPPFVITEDEIDRLVATLRQAVDAAAIAF
jgi:adenosylmethionine-8-amino-7-oxononanoate aminotransferase